MTQNSVNIEGFECYAPEFLEDNSHFPVESYETLYNLEKGHFWFESRNRIILNQIKKFLDHQNNLKVLEVGCGTGFVLEGIYNQNPNFDLEGTELYLEGLKFARSRSKNLNFFQSDVRALPFRNKYDAICAFDVIEHIEEDDIALKSINHALKPGGYLFISVPQHMWLWSKQDEIACHKRRYTRKELSSKLRENGFSICYMTSFVSTLLPLMLVSRLRSNPKEELDELKISKFMNELLALGMKVDEALIKLGFSLSLGGSLLCVGKKF